jgi:hypothetical protein
VPAEEDAKTACSASVYSRTRASRPSSCGLSAPKKEA